jgi:hypothetical protein
MTGLTSEHKKVIEHHRALHLLKAFLAITKKKQAKSSDLVKQAEAEFKNRIAGDSKLNDVMKSQALLGNKNTPIDGEAFWSRVKEYKSKIINIYQVVFKEDPPSSTTSLNDILEVCRKKVWFKEQTKKVISKGGEKPLSWKECPKTFEPADWFTFTQLYDHVKLQFIDASSGNKENDPE